jgi:hypothetical protein
MALKNDISLYHSPISTEAFGVFTIAEFCILNEKSGIDITQAHPSNCFGMIMVSEGNANHSIDFQNYPIQKGTIVFFSKNQVQQFFNLDKLEGFIVLFQVDFLGLSFKREDLTAYNHLFNYHLYSPTLQCDSEEGLSIGNLFKELHREVKQSNKKEDSSLIADLFRLIIIKAARVRNLAYGKVQLKQLQEFNALQNLISNHAIEHRDVGFYVKTLDQTLKRMNHVVQKVKGMTTKELINRHVILLVKRSLSNSNLSIRTISDYYNFDESTNFIKFFKKYTGETPNQFRKKHIGHE